MCRDRNFLDGALPRRIFSAKVYTFITNIVVMCKIEFSDGVYDTFVWFSIQQNLALRELTAASSVCTPSCLQKPGTLVSLNQRQKCCGCILAFHLFRKGSKRSGAAAARPSTARGRQSAAATAPDGRAPKRVRINHGRRSCHARAAEQQTRAC